MQRIFKYDGGDFFGVLDFNISDTLFGVRPTLASNFPFATCRILQEDDLMACYFLGYYREVLGVIKTTNEDPSLKYFRDCYFEVAKAFWLEHYCFKCIEVHEGTPRVVLSCEFLRNIRLTFNLPKTPDMLVLNVRDYVGDQTFPVEKLKGWGSLVKNYFE